MNDLLFVILVVSERYEPRDEEGGNGAEEHEYKEMAIAQSVAHRTAEHSRQHNSKVHNARSKCIVRHLMLSRRDLLHHKERQTYETESVTEVFEDDSAAYQPQTLRLVKSQKGVSHER